MEIYDKNGEMIGYVRSSDISKHPLTETRQSGERKREQWFRDIASRSRAENWTMAKLKEFVEQDVLASPHLSEKSAAKSEGILAGNPGVRDHYERLVSLRDEVWEKDKKFLQRIKHGPQQLLVDIMRRQSRGTERVHTENAAKYLAFMHKEYDT